MTPATGWPACRGCAPWSGRAGLALARRLDPIACPRRWWFRPMLSRHQVWVDDHRVRLWRRFALFGGLLLVGFLLVEFLLRHDGSSLSKLDRDDHARGSDKEKYK